jgi:dTDP-4-amino-4,6-dideoxygalactose transaminase
MLTEVAHLAIDGGEPAVPTDAHRYPTEFDEDDYKALERLVGQSGLWGIHGRELKALEEAFATYIDAEYCLAVSSGTAALHVALVGAGVTPGSDVIVPALTHPSTALAVLQAGATPVFADIDPLTHNIAPAEVAAKITERTSAVMTVHLHGLPADIHAVSKAINGRPVAIVEDAAQAAGASYRGQKVGTLGDTAAFSFNATKTLRGLEGGMVVFRDAEALRAGRLLANYGQDAPPLAPGESRGDWTRYFGFMYRMDGLEAALIQSRLTKLDEIQDAARSNARMLSARLVALPGIMPPVERLDSERVFWTPRIVLEPEAFGWDGPAVEFRNRIITALRAEGVAANTWQLYPLPAHPAFRRQTIFPWSAGVEQPPISDWDRDGYPATERLLNSSLVVADRSRPLWVQTPSLMTAYADAFEKVVLHIDRVLSSPYQPLKFKPPIPEDEL